MGLIGEIIRSFKVPGGVLVERHSPGTKIKGRYVKGSTVSFTVDPVAIHPASGKQLDMLPEGKRTTQSKIIYTQKELFADDAPGVTNADIVNYKGQRYEIHNVADWEDNGGFFVYAGVRMSK